MTLFSPRSSPLLSSCGSAGHTNCLPEKNSLFYEKMLKQTRAGTHTPMDARTQAHTQAHTHG